MVDFDSPLRWAIAARDQCVSPPTAGPGVDSSVAMITSSTWSRVIEGGRPGRGSSDSPSRRRSVNLLRQRCTVEVSRPSSAAIC